MALINALGSIENALIAHVIGYPPKPQYVALKGTVAPIECVLFIPLEGYDAKPPVMEGETVERRNVVLTSDRNGVPYAFGETVKDRVERNTGRRQRIPMVSGLMLKAQWVSDGSGWVINVHMSPRKTTALVMVNVPQMTFEAFADKLSAVIANPPRKPRKPRLNEAERLFLDYAKQRLGYGFCQSQVLSEIRRDGKAYDLTEESVKRISQWL